MYYWILTSLKQITVRHDAEYVLILTKIWIGQKLSQYAKIQKSLYSTSHTRWQCKNNLKECKFKMKYFCNEKY